MDFDELQNELGLTDTTWTQDLRLTAASISTHIAAVGVLLAEAKKDQRTLEMELTHFEAVMISNILTKKANSKIAEWRVRSILEADRGWAQRKQNFTLARERAEALEAISRALFERSKLCLALLGEDWRNEWKKHDAS
jgi:hypothetical protein